MKIAPIDISHKEFGRKFMGYDPHSVNDFLALISAEMEELLRERNALKEAVRERDLAIVEFKERDQALKKTLETATQMAERIRADAEREAKLIVNDANYRAETMTRDARDSIKRIYNDINDLKKLRIQFESNLRALAQAHLALLDEGTKYMPTLKTPVATGETNKTSNSTTMTPA